MIGALGLSTIDAGEVVQALGACLIDRGFTRDTILGRLETFNESRWWEYMGGDIVDRFAVWLDLPTFPDDD